MEKIKINRQVLWMAHESIQRQMQPIRDFYDKNTDVIEAIDAKRQEITKKYYQFNDDGTLKENAQKQYVLIKGKQVKDYDDEMEVLMSGTEEIEASELQLQVQPPPPAPEMKVVN